MISILKDLVNPVTKLIGKAIPDKDKAMEITAELNKLGGQLEEKLVDAKTKVMVAELQQGSKYVKYARPTIIYVGLIAMVINSLILPWITFAFGTELPKIDMPSEFYYAWAGVAGVYSYGRSQEKIKGLKS